MLKPDHRFKERIEPVRRCSGRKTITAARMIRLQQSRWDILGEILALNEEYRAGSIRRNRTAEVRRHRSKGWRSEAALDAAPVFLRGKVDWIKAGKPDGARLEAYRC